jgi:hypothetical protein
MNQTGEKKMEQGHSSQSYIQNRVEPEQRLYEAHQVPPAAAQEHDFQCHFEVSGSDRVGVRTGVEVEQAVSPDYAVHEAQAHFAVVLESGELPDQHLT